MDTRSLQLRDELVAQFPSARTSSTVPWQRSSPASTCSSSVPPEPRSACLSVRSRRRSAAATSSGSSRSSPCRNDRFVRVTTGKLPEAEFAFVNEISKSNSAVLNTMLSIVNEREFHNDGGPMQCRLVTLFGASNELPQGRELFAASCSGSTSSTCWLLRTCGRSCPPETRLSPPSSLRTSSGGPRQRSRP
jgi:hypothetical protein